MLRSTEVSKEIGEQCKWGKRTFLDEFEWNKQTNTQTTKTTTMPYKERSRLTLPASLDPLGYMQANPILGAAPSPDPPPAQADQCLRTAKCHLLFEDSTAWLRTKLWEKTDQAEGTAPELSFKSISFKKEKPRPTEDQHATHCSPQGLVVEEGFGPRTPPSADALGVVLCFFNK